MDKPEWWKRKVKLPGGCSTGAIQDCKRLRAQRRFTTSEICDRELAQSTGSNAPSGIIPPRAN